MSKSHIDTFDLLRNEVLKLKAKGNNKVAEDLIDDYIIDKLMTEEVEDLVIYNGEVCYKEIYADYNPIETNFDKHRNYYIKQVMPLYRLVNAEPPQGLINMTYCDFFGIDKQSLENIDDKFAKMKEGNDQRRQNRNNFILKYFGRRIQMVCTVIYAILCIALLIFFSLYMSDYNSWRIIYSDEPIGVFCQCCIPIVIVLTIIYIIILNLTSSYRHRKSGIDEIETD